MFIGDRTGGGGGWVAGSVTVTMGVTEARFLSPYLLRNLANLPRALREQNQLNVYLNFPRSRVMFNMCILTHFVLRTLREQIIRVFNLKNYQLLVVLTQKILMNKI